MEGFRFLRQKIMLLQAVKYFCNSYDFFCKGCPQIMRQCLSQNYAPKNRPSQNYAPMFVPELCAKKSTVPKLCANVCPRIMRQKIERPKIMRQCLSQNYAPKNRPSQNYAPMFVPELCAKNRPSQNYAPMFVPELCANVCPRIMRQKISALNLAQLNAPRASLNLFTGVSFLAHIGIWDDRFFGA
jgi:hypothetical protein